MRRDRFGENARLRKATDDAHCAKGSLLVAFSLLTSAATACAECAWVLWEDTIDPADK